MTTPTLPLAGTDRSFDRFAAVAAIVSLPLALGNLLAMLAAVHFDLRGMNDPLVLLRAGAGAAPVWRWSMILDIFGYYLSIVPLILVMRTAFLRRAPSWIDLSALCLLAYCLIGVAGGAVLATALPTMIKDYAANPSHRVDLQLEFVGYTDGVYRGLWNLLEEFLAGIGWLGFGWALRPARPRLATLTQILGTACLVDSFGIAVDVEIVGAAGLSAYLVLAPLWACLSGFALLRTPLSGDAQADHREIPRPRPAELPVAKAPGNVYTL